MDRRSRLHDAPQGVRSGYSVTERYLKERFAHEFAGFHAHIDRHGSVATAPADSPSEGALDLKEALGAKLDIQRSKRDTSRRVSRDRCVDALGRVRARSSVSTAGSGATR